MRPPNISVLIFAGAAAFLSSPLALRQLTSRSEKAASLSPSRNIPPLPPPQGEGGQGGSPQPAGTSAGVDFLPAYFALDPSASIDDAGARAAFNPADPFGGLPQTEGYELVAARCAACHSLNVVMQQSLPQERWDYLLTWMSASKGMPPLEPEDRRVVLAYLTQHFGAK